MDEVQRFITSNQHQFGYIMGEASRQWIAKDPVGALTVGPCNIFVEKDGGYHELLEKVEQLSKTNAELLECLAWYGDEQTYKSQLRLINRYGTDTPIKRDSGSRAREMIAKVKGMQE